jgi:hypothetical protein
VVPGCVLADVVVGERPPTVVIVPHDTSAEAAATISNAGTGRNQPGPSMCAYCHVYLRTGRGGSLCSTRGQPELTTTNLCRRKGWGKDVALGWFLRGFPR